GYRAARWFEPGLSKRLSKRSTDDSHRQLSAESSGEEALLMFFRTLVVFDRVQQQVRIVAVVLTDEVGGNENRLRELYETAVRETARIEELLRFEPQTPSNLTGLNEARRDRELLTAEKSLVRSNWSKDDFHRAVNEVKEHIFAGDCY